MAGTDRKGRESTEGGRERIGERMGGKGKRRKDGKGKVERGRKEVEKGMGKEWEVK